MMRVKYNFKSSYLKKLFSDVQLEKIPLKIISRSKSKKKKKPSKALQKRYPYYGAWDRYIKHKLAKERIQKGIQFFKKYKSTLKKVEKTYGVPAEYIVAIIGIESLYGHNVGQYGVFNTLTTLSFEKNRRNKFFKKQLREFIRLTYSYRINPKNILGSYAGAIGLGQFMPSNYEKLAIDFNGDGKKQMNNHIDAIGSIAHYFKENGWQKDAEVTVRVRYKGKRFTRVRTGYKYKYHRASLKGIKPIRAFNYHGKVSLIKLKRRDYDELWYGAKNFFVITRYNHSSYYAMAVYQLAKRIREKY